MSDTLKSAERRLGYLLLRDGHAIPLHGISPEDIKEGAKHCLLHPDVDPLKHRQTLNAIVDRLGFAGDHGTYLNKGWPEFQAFLKKHSCTNQVGVFPIDHGGCIDLCFADHAVAEALADFGLADMAHLVEQAKARQAFLDKLEALARDPKTLEAQLHKAIEKSLWLIGPQYSLFSSNKTLARQSEDYLDKKFTGERAKDRPDLLLNENLDGAALLIEFKRPSHPLNHDDYQQATGYRHDLHKVMNKPIEVLLIGGKRSPDFPQKDLEPNVRVLSYSPHRKLRPAAAVLDRRLSDRPCR